MRGSRGCRAAPEANHSSGLTGEPHHAAAMREDARHSGCRRLTPGRGEGRTRSQGAGDEAGAETAPCARRLLVSLDATWNPGTRLCEL